MPTLVTFATEDAEISLANAVYASAAGNYPGTAIDTSSATARVGQQLSGGTYTCFQMAMRFDTSPIGPSAVSAAKCTVVPSALNNSRIWSPEIGPCDENGPAGDTWNNPFTTSDWANASAIHLDEPWQIHFTSELVVSTPIDFTWAPATNANHIKPNGDTCLRMFSLDQETQTAPTTTDVSTFNTVEAAGTTNDPKVTIVYGTIIRSAGTLGTTGTTDLSIPYPTTPTAGDRFVAVITAQDNVASTRSGWTLILGVNNGSGLRTEVWSRDAFATGSETGSVTWTRTSGHASMGRMFNIGGSAPFGSPIEASASSANSSSSTVTFPGVTTLEDNALIIAVQSLVGLGSFGVPSGTDPTFVEQTDDNFDGRPVMVTTAHGNNGGGGTTLAFTMPTVQGGDLVIASMDLRASTSATASRTGWTEKGTGVSDGSTSIARTLFYRVPSDGTGDQTGTTVTFTITSGKGSIVAIVLRNAFGTGTADPFDQFVTNTVTTANTVVTPSAATPGTTNCFDFCFAHKAADTTAFSVASGYTLRASDGATSGGAASTRSGSEVSTRDSQYPASGSPASSVVHTFSGTTARLIGIHCQVKAVDTASAQVSMEVAADYKTTQGAIASGRTATATVAGVNTGILLALTQYRFFLYDRYDQTDQHQGLIAQ